MKKVALVASLCLLIGINCKKTDPNLQNLLVGNWTHIKDVINMYDSAGKYLRTDTESYNGPHNIFQFHSNGTGIIDEPFFVNLKVYDTVSFTYTINGNMLNFNIQGQVEKDTVLKLNSSTLIIHSNVSTVFNGTVAYSDKTDSYFIK